MSGMFGGGGRRDVTQTTAPWAPQVPYITQGFQQAQDAFLNAQRKGNSGIPTTSPYTTWAQTQTANRGMNPSPYETAGRNELSKTLSGDYLYGGAGFNAAFDAAKNKIIPEVSSNFERFGRRGSGAESAAATGALGDAFAGLYNQERQRQMGAMSEVPNYTNMDFANIGRVGAAGKSQEDYQREQLNARRELIKQYLASISGNYGGTTTQPGAGAIGGLPGALMGAGSGALQGFGATKTPWGAAAGAGVGLLSSIFN